jgi:hypothetical protein
VAQIVTAKIEAARSIRPARQRRGVLTPGVPAPCVHCAQAGTTVDAMGSVPLDNARPSGCTALRHEIEPDQPPRLPPSSLCRR